MGLGKTRGFTLLETLLATIILTIGVIAVSWAINMGIFASTDAENTAKAIGIAQTKLETIYGSISGVANEAVHSVSTEGFTGDIYQNQNFQVAVTTDDNNPEEVSVTVYWDTTGGQTYITLTTLIASY